MGTSHPLNQTVQQQLADAMKRKYRVTRCPVCDGPVVHSKDSKPASASRLTNLPPDLKLRMMNGRASLKELEPYIEAGEVSARCLRCGEPAAAIRQTFRKCKLCGGSMKGTLVTENFCLRCSKLSKHERSKKLRWKADREARKQPDTPLQVGV